MKERRDRIDRRSFLKKMGKAGLVPAFAGMTSGLAAGKVATDSNEPSSPDARDKTQESKLSQLPMRTLGKTNVKVPCLGIGTNFNLVDNQVILRSAIKHGVTYWDTSHTYAGGNSELGIGKFFEKNPEVRENLFIVSKASRARTIDDFEERLQLSLESMNTNYIDLYFAPHGLSDPNQLTDGLRQWAEGAKKRKLIKYFGFSTHSNMAKCLAAAAKLDWVDALMTIYNFRVMQDAEMQAAIDACHEAKIGLVAMKTAGRAIRNRWSQGEGELTEAEKKLMERFLKQGFTQEQAAIKLVLEDERISCACVGMETVPILTANVAAVLDKTKLARADRKVFEEYAAVTCTGYCTGCAEICDSALADKLYVSDVMRYLMYYNSYGDKDRARGLFAQLPSKVRNKLLSTDYRVAEARCPQRLPIGEFVVEAVSKLA